MVRASHLIVFEDLVFRALLDGEGVPPGRPQPKRNIHRIRMEERNEKKRQEKKEKRGKEVNGEGKEGKGRG